MVWLTQKIKWEKAWGVLYQNKRTSLRNRRWNSWWKRIDELNIYEATKVAMKEAIANCNIKPEHILIDAMPLECGIPTTSIIKGDLKV